MTNEQDREGRDELVSATYRELDAPRTPDHLNQTILRMAADKSTGKGSFLFAAWMKPVAWAATIGLSLAIVLELSDVPTTPVQMDAVPALEPKVESKVESIAEELVLEDTELLKSEAKRKTDSFAASLPAAARPAARKRAVDQPAADLSDARQQVRAEAVASFALSMEKKESDAAAACDTKARQSADDWLECIDNLRESGAVEEAEREYAAFKLEYPVESTNSESNK